MTNTTNIDPGRQRSFTDTHKLIMSEINRLNQLMVKAVHEGNTDAVIRFDKKRKVWNEALRYYSEGIS